MTDRSRPSLRETRRGSGRPVALAVTCILCSAAASTQAATYTIESLGFLPGDSRSGPIAMSDDGEVVFILSDDGIRATLAVWTAADGLQPVAQPGFVGGMRPISGGSEIFVGQSCGSSGECDAYVWTRTTGLTSIGSLLGMPYSDLFGGPGRYWGANVALGRACESVQAARSDQCQEFLWTATGSVRYLGALPGRTISRVRTVSSDGSTLVGRSCNRTPASGFVDCEAFRYDVDSDTMTGLGVLPGYSQSEAIGISADNQVISVNSYVPSIVTWSSAPSASQAGYWTASEGLVGIGMLAGDSISSTGLPVVGAGRTIIGGSASGPHAAVRPFVWSTADGMQELPQNSTPSPGAPSFLTPTASLIVGYGGGPENLFGVAWSAPDWQQDLLRLPGDNSVNFTLVVTDAAVFGESGIDSNDGDPPTRQPFRWTRTDGMQALGHPPGGGLRADITDATRDGTVVVGRDVNSTFTSQEAFVWRLGDGMKGLGFLTDTHKYSEALFVSEDGAVILGGSGDEHVQEAVIWRRHISNTATTPTGEQVSVDLDVSLPGGGSTSSVDVVFGSVETSGTTTVTASDTPAGTPEAPSGFSVGNPSVYYDVTTTAEFSGTVALCFSWNEGQFDNEAGVRLFHYQDSAWTDVTASIDTQANQVCGQVTSLSPFALFEFSYAFTGFFPPVDNPPVSNVAKAGTAIPVKFSLGGNWGLSIFKPNYPAAQAVSCDSGDPQDAVTETATPGSSELSYDPLSDQYIYVWKTQKSWAHSCRRLTLKFADGSQQSAEFGFRK